MHDSRWQQLWSLFDDLRDRSADQRRAVLDTLADRELATELTRLLEAHDSGNSPLDADPLASAIGALAAGDRLGPWQLLALVAEGGMGQVWRASRADGRYRQQVAIKFPVLSGSAALRARFDSERRVLAQLEHPHIARLLDGGATASGWPYLVMQWVEGEAITSYSERKALSANARLKLFLPICRAVEHAHRKLILHRDIKPGNILVDADGHAMLLDFGIAKPLAELGHAVEQTRSALAFTPDYAAPEQIRGEPVGTPADVHALGAVLYEVLTGQHAFDRNHRTLADLIEDTGKIAPAPSSRLSSDRRRQRLLAGDLDQIVLKAVHPDPERRYPTAAALADDLDKWLAGRPVGARADSPGYRLRKFVGRHPHGVIAGTTAVLGLVALSAFLALQSHRLRAALDVARSQTVRAQTVSDFLSDLFNQASPRKQAREAPDLRKLLTQGVAQIDAAALAPDISGDLKQTMGAALVDIGELQRGQRTLLEALEELPDSATIPRLRALTSLAQAENMADKIAPALRHQRQALALALVSGDALRIRAAKAGLGMILSNAGQRDQARALLLEALQGLHDRGSRRERLQLADARSKMASLYWSDGNYRKAQEQYEQVYSTIVDIYGEHHARTADTLYALGAVHLQQGNYARATDYLNRTLSLMQSMYEPVHPLTARTQNALGATLYQSGHSAQAREHYREALAMEEKLFGGNSPRLIRVLGNLALVEHDLGQFTQAQHLYRRAIALDSTEHPKGSERQIAPLVDLALLELDQDQPGGALVLLDRADTIRRQHLPEQHPSTAFIAHVRGMALLALDRTDAAILQLERARELRSRQGDGRHPHLADTLILLARARQRAAAQAPADVIALAERALRISQDKRGVENWRTQEIELRLGRILEWAGQVERGRKLELSAMQALIRLRGSDDWQVRRLRSASAI
ncbi:MAG: serine/threonine-protein kinase [Rhodanobacteraceae bacterium]